MRLHIYFGAAAVLSAVLGLTGCKTASVSSNPNGPPSVGETSKPTKASERRTEAHARYANAILLDLNDEPEMAAAECYKAALADLTSETLILEASSRLLRLKQNDKALELLTEAAKQPEASTAVLVRLAAVCVLTGKKDDAIRVCQKVILKNPRSISAYQQLAQIHLQDRAFASALKVLEKAAAIRNTDAAFLIDLSELYAAYVRGGATNVTRGRALELLNRAIAQNPSNPVLLQRLADGFQMLGDLDKAIEFTLKLKERFPALPGWREKLIDLYLAKEDPAKASQLLEEIIREAPTDPRAYLSLGKIAMEQKKPKDAITHFEKVLLLRPDFEPAYYELAIAQMAADKSRDALATLEKARARYPKSFAVEFYSARAWGLLKEYSNAIRHFTTAEVIASATATNLLNQSFYFHFGSAYERNGQHEEAVKYFRRALALQPDFSEALNYLGYMWADRGENLGEAHDMIERAVKLEPKNAAYLDSLGWVLFKMNKPKEALTWLLKAVEYLEEPDATIYDHLGDVYTALNEKDKAREVWQKALSIDPSDIKDQVRKKLEAATSGGPR